MRQSKKKRPDKSGPFYQELTETFFGLSGDSNLNLIVVGT
jgi:hypothetical protein